jgi:hypothetical protein
MVPVPFHFRHIREVLEPSTVVGAAFVNGRIRHGQIQSAMKNLKKRCKKAWSLLKTVSNVKRGAPRLNVRQALALKLLDTSSVGGWDRPQAESKRLKSASLSWRASRQCLAALSQIGRHQRSRFLDFPLPSTGDVLSQEHRSTSVDIFRPSSIFLRSSRL